MSEAEERAKQSQEEYAKDYSGNKMSWKELSNYRETETPWASYLVELIFEFCAKEEAKAVSLARKEEREIGTKGLIARDMLKDNHISKQRDYLLSELEKTEKELKEVEARVLKDIQKRIDWLEFKSPVTFKTFIFGKDEFDIELEKLKKLKRFLSKPQSGKGLRKK